MLCLFGELFTADGALDLLFHPRETTFTLEELHGMLSCCGLESLGVVFMSAAADRHAPRARTRRRPLGGGRAGAAMGVGVRGWGPSGSQPGWLARRCALATPARRTAAGAFRTRVR